MNIYKKYFDGIKSGSMPKSLSSIKDKVNGISGLKNKISSAKSTLSSKINSVKSGTVNKLKSGALKKLKK